MRPPLILCGPTGAGKSAVALRLAERHGATIVSMDAMQVYRGLDIGTAKVSGADRARVPHVGIDVVNPDEPFSAADFVRMADATIASGVPTILAGGTTFYLRAWRQGLVPAPPVDLELRARLEALPEPHAALLAVDPVLAARLHPNDRMRIVRGLEVWHATGHRLSELHAADARVERPATVLWIDVPDLYERIDARVESMMAAGYLDEVRGLLERGYARSLKPMQSLGYKHLAAHLAGEMSLDEAVRLTMRDTRHFARKQRMFGRSIGAVPTPPDAGSLDDLAARTLSP